MQPPLPVHSEEPERASSDAGATAIFAVERFRGSTRALESDTVAVEEPLELRLVSADEPRSSRTVAITMRTPGADAALAVGFLFTEGLIRSFDDLVDVQRCGGSAAGNVVRVTVAAHCFAALPDVQRSFYTSSSCGVCGKASIDAIAVPFGAIGDVLRIRRRALHGLPEALRQQQPTFALTGGIHGCALFDASGLRGEPCEDVGRHNALDKLIGALFQSRALPSTGFGVLLSGRASFELVQKALVAGIECIAAVGAPSSLAVDLARKHGATLVGFLGAERCNVYAGGHRILEEGG